jgi:putative spermidine/putrescine transport system permease protein
MTSRAGVEPRAARIGMRIATGFVLAFLYIPFGIIVLYAFNESIGQSWPIEEFSTKWFSVAWNNNEVRDALLTSVQAATAASALALLLGSLAAFAVHRFKFFGRGAVSFLLVLPIALPGIVTGMALNSTINLGGEYFGISFSLFTIIVGHATFCVVVVYNNVVARLRRTPTSLVEASMDLGADGWQTFRHVTLPSLMTALVAGALLAFALSFDEIIVTNFTSGTEITLPKWIFNNLRLPRQRPQVNVVAAVVVIASFIPVYVAQRLTQEPVGAGRAPRGGLFRGFGRKTDAAVERQV